MASHSVRIGISVAVLSVLITFAYQNCMQTLPDGSADDSSLQVGDSTPFAFDTKVDQLAYMSCTDLPVNADKQTYFTYRVRAANSKAGLGVTPAFRTYMTNQGLASNRQAQISYLNQSLLNRASYLQLAVRPDGNMRTTVETTAIQPDGYGNIGQSSWGFLTDNDLLKQILTTFSTSATPIKQYSSTPLVLSVNYTSLATGAEEDNFHAKLAFGQNNMVVLGYGAGFGDSNERIVSPLDVIGAAPASRETVYGRGFQFAYSHPYRDMTTRIDTVPSERVLSGVREYDLSNRALAARNWSCRIFLDQFKIVPNDPTAAAEAGCANPQSGMPTPSTSDDVQSFALADSLLNAEGQYWLIDAVNRCVFPAQPASNACYRPGSIEWNFTQFCGGDGQKQCPHYVSFCQTTY